MANMKQFRAAADARMADLCHPRRTFANLVGERYVACRFENFDAGNDSHAEQRHKALATCQAIASKITEVIGRGQNVVLVGPVGTGKDHLGACMLREVVRAGLSCERINGADLAGQCRDLIGGHSTERDFLERWASVKLLFVSDLDGSREKATDFYAEWLYRIVDSRYRDSASVWANINAKSDQDARDRVGARIWDRIIHRAIVIRTNWPSYRKPARGVN